MKMGSLKSSVDLRLGQTFAVERSEVQSILNTRRNSSAPQLLAVVSSEAADDGVPWTGTADDKRMTQLKQEVRWSVIYSKSAVFTLRSEELTMRTLTLNALGDFLC